ncbi:LptF/LptG family permease [Gammaproteobacteria bacterium]|jgi:lipopolysaccharide export system permease protein|nr:LptF/LptG family permease [SAR86 cluster bacterium]MDA8526983.1 LptF/LptG family permease [Gammaproteobacteria bacterium]MBL6822383.1 LptF/LptG family permease [SAR86 cluster bacterium]MDA9205082.1 LptF/LptG family permease [Gammaproteobacteria bacterium]MDA9800240.1 LptF/LptG family permease [Gammaproteobacteria bacterium]
MNNILNIYSRHLIKKTFLISALVWIVMLFLDLSVTLVMELENLDDDNGFISIFNVVLYEQLHKGMQYLESSMLIGTLIALSIFNQQGNLVFLRSAGLSPLKIVLISGLGPIILSLALIFFDETFFLDLSKKSKTMNQPTGSAEVFQWEISEKNLIGLRRINSNQAEAIQIIEFNDNQRIASSSSFQEGKLDQGQLVILDSPSQPSFEFPSSFLLSNNVLETFSLSSLLDLKRTYQLDKDLQKIDSLIYARVLLPVSIIAIIFLAGSLMFDSLRLTGVGRQIIIGISLGLIYDLTKDLSVASFLTYQWPILIAHLLPIMILIGIGAYKFQRI